MQPVKAESHYGQTVILDQCPSCGGIWFDDFELHRTKQGQSDKIELLDPAILRTPADVQNSDLLCPRDRTKLVRFTDPFFPRDIIIARCPACNGFWLNRGEFTKYQQYRQTLKKPEEIIIEDNKFERDVARLLEEYQTGNAAGVLGKLGSFLSTPMDSLTWRPLEPEKLSAGEKTALNMILNTLSLVLRFFIRI